MKKAILFAVLFLTGIILLLNIQVTTRQGINYRVSTFKIPLYLKTLDFYDRHFNYKRLVRQITAGQNSDKAKVMSIFSWTAKTILPQPKELPVVDDHVWHIIVRGYGTGDQPSDVFTTLCNYAGFDAFFYRVTNKGKTLRIPFSFVKIKGRWYLFDPQQGIYFLNREGSLAALEDLVKGNYQEVNIRNPGQPGPDYSQLFSEVTQIDCERYHYFSRANIQSPLNRLIYAVKKAASRH
jgi:hypothetical protein